MWQARFAFIDSQRIRRFWTSELQRMMASSQTADVLYIILAKLGRFEDHFQEVTAPLGIRSRFTA